MSFQTIDQINRRADEEGFMYIDNLASAHRRDAEVFASMASDIMDTTQSVVVADESGAERSEIINDRVMNLTTGNEEIINDLSRGRFVPTVEIGRAYETQRTETRDELKEIMMAEVVDANLRQIASLQYFTLAEGSGMQLVRDYAEKQLVLMGIKDPTTEEHREALQAQQEAQAQQGQNDPNLIFAEAEMLKAQTGVEKSQADAIKSLEQAEKYKAETYKTLIEAEEKSEQTIGNQIENAERLAAALRPQSAGFIQ